jgi:uncharacterized membrane protein YfcA
VLRFAILCLGAFLIGVSKAGFGGGAFLVVPPLVSLVLPPREGLGLLLPLLLATDVMAMVRYRGLWDRRCVGLLLPPALAGIALGGQLLQVIPSELLVRVIGLLALIFGGAQLVQARRPAPADEAQFRPWMGAALGFGAGVTSTLAHLGGVLTTIYLLPQRLGPAQFVATCTLIYFFMNAAKLPAYARQDLLPAAIWRQDGLLLPALVAGVLVGFALNGRVSPRRFNAILIGIVFVTGLYLLVRPVAHPAHADRHPLPLQPGRV